MIQRSLEGYAGYGRMREYKCIEDLLLPSNLGLEHVRHRDDNGQAEAPAGDEGQGARPCANARDEEQQRQEEASRAEDLGTGSFRLPSNRR